MQAKEAVKIALSSTQNLLNWYLSDLSDQDLTLRPVPSANNIAWQMGHLIHSEPELLGSMPGATYPELPATLKQDYTGKKSGVVPPGGYLPKAQYLEWFTKMRTATLANVDRITDADLDRPTTGEMAKFAPNLGALLLLTANHTLMHAGQFTVVRRALNKPVLF